MEKKIEQLIANKEAINAKIKTDSDEPSEKEYLRRIAKNTKIVSNIVVAYFILIVVIVIVLALLW